MGCAVPIQMLAEFNREKQMNFTHKADYRDLPWRKITGRKDVNISEMLRKLLVYRNKAGERETIITAKKYSLKTVLKGITRCALDLFPYVQLMVRA